MSAYVVTDATISAMLQAVRFSRQVNYSNEIYVYWNGDKYGISYHNLQEVGQKLLDENWRSVNYRYDGRMGEHEQQRKYKHRQLRQFTPVEIIKACNGYRYQACECPDWRETEAYEIFDTLREVAIRALPGYEEADTWEVYEEALV